MEILIRKIRTGEICFVGVNSCLGGLKINLLMWNSSTIGGWTWIRQTFDWKTIYANFMNYLGSNLKVLCWQVDSAFHLPSKDLTLLQRLKGFTISQITLIALGICGSVDSGRPPARWMTYLIPVTYEGWDPNLVLNGSTSDRFDHYSRTWLPMQNSFYLCNCLTWLVKFFILSYYLI